MWKAQCSIFMQDKGVELHLCTCTETSAIKQIQKWPEIDIKAQLS